MFSPTAALLGLGSLDLQPMDAALQLPGLRPGSLAGLVKQEPLDHFLSPRAVGDLHSSLPGFLSSCGIHPATPTSVGLFPDLLSGVPSVPTTPFGGPGGGVFNSMAPCLPFTSSELAVARAQAFLRRAAELQER